MSLRIGIDLGGTKIEIIALDKQGQILSRERVSTPKNYTATIQAITDLVHRVEQRLNTQGTLTLKRQNHKIWLWLCLRGKLPGVIKHGAITFNYI